VVKRGREGGEGAWLLSLELLQFANNHDASTSVPSSTRSRSSNRHRPGAAADTARRDARASPAPTLIGRQIARVWMTATPSPSCSAAYSPDRRTRNSRAWLEFAQRKPIVPIDMTAVDRIDFVCAGSLLNAINRIEHQRKAVQIIGASPIIRALLLLIGISPRHFLKRAT
jgi:ABC-type transporter Mla MlaB component